MNFENLFYSLAAIVNEMSPYILLGFLIAGLLHVFVRPEMMSRHLAGKGAAPVVKAALFGIPLPLCSCGVLPTAVSLRRQGASRGAATSFLIATPQTGVDSIAATYSLLGLPFAILRPVAALVGAVLGGVTVSKTDRGDGAEEVIESAHECHDHCCEVRELPRSFFGKLVESVRYGLVDMVGSVGKWLVIGLIVAALITVLVPDSLFTSLSQYPVLAMLVMVVVAIPMYICATGSIPIALSLMLKGLSPGVAFVLLMAGPAANFASIMVLGKAIGRRATAIYVGSVVVTAMAFGLLIDYLLPAGWFVPSISEMVSQDCHQVTFPIFPTLCSILLVGLLIYAAVRSRGHKREHQHINSTDMIKTYKIDGMACGHCKATVEKAVGALKGCESAVVDLSSGTVKVVGSVDPAAVSKAVALAGFTFSGTVEDLTAQGC